MTETKQKEVLNMSVSKRKRWVFEFVNTGGSTIVSQFKPINETSVDFTFFHSDTGIKDRLPGVNGSTKQYVVVLQELIIPYEKINLNLEELKKRANNPYYRDFYDLEKIEELIATASTKNPRRQGLKVDIYHEYDIDEINRQHPTICNLTDSRLLVCATRHENDVDVSLLELDRLEDHRTIRLYESDSITGINYEIVDNNGNISKRYVVHGKQVLTIKPYTDLTRLEGLHISIARGRGTSVEKHHYSLESEEEWTEFGLFRNKEDATSYADRGDASQKISDEELKQKRLELENTRRKLELITAQVKAAEDKLALDMDSTVFKSELEKANALHAREIELLKLEALRQKTESDKAQQEWNIEYEKLKAKLAKRKLKREDKSHSSATERDNTSSVIKTTGAVVVGVIAIIVAVVKFSASSFSFW